MHRLRFEKQGRAVYLSHLDLMRTLQRVFARAGLSIRHTEGFNPHPYLSIALPLSVGVSSRCELLDFELLEEMPLTNLPDSLTAKAPEGLHVLEAYEARKKVKEIAWLEVSGNWVYDGPKSAAKMVEKLEEFYRKPEILVTKKTKKKEEVQLDMVPLIREITFASVESEQVEMKAVIAAQHPGLNPVLLVEAIRQNAPEIVPNFARFAREEVYDKAMAVFR